MQLQQGGKLGIVVVCVLSEVWLNMGTDVAWFSNRYVCPICRVTWDSDWSSCCDDECPDCGLSDVSPVTSEDDTIVARPENEGSWQILLSSPEAEEDPCYVLLGKFRPNDVFGFQFTKHHSGT
jgi:hypothetical protein